MPRRKSTGSYKYNRGTALDIGKVGVSEDHFEEVTFNLKPKELGISHGKNGEECSKEMDVYRF